MSSVLEAADYKLPTLIQITTTSGYAATKGLAPSLELQAAYDPGESGQYAVEIADAGGCVDTSSCFTFCIASSAEIAPQGDSLLAGVADAQYQWLDCNNNNAPIAGATNSTFVPTGSGTYSVAIMSSIGSTPNPAEVWIRYLHRKLHRHKCAFAYRSCLQAPPQPSRGSADAEPSQKVLQNQSLGLHPHRSTRAHHPANAGQLCHWRGRYLTYKRSLRIQMGIPNLRVMTEDQVFTSKVCQAVVGFTHLCKPRENLRGLFCFPGEPQVRYLLLVTYSAMAYLTPYKNPKYFE